MNSVQSFLKSPTGRYYILALFIYSAAIPIFIYLHFHGLCPDEAAYYNIAVKYKGLHFKEALNAYWSPLMSWLVAPLLNIPFFAFHEIMIINFLCGFVLFYLTYKFSKRHQLETIPELIFLFSMACLITFIQLPLFGADFLSATAFIVYIFLVTSPRNKDNSSFYIATALAALLCAFAKSFFIFYLVLHLLVMVSISWRKKEPASRIHISNLFKIIIIYVVGISIWAGLLSWKYERFMINSSGAYNLSLISPQGYLKHYSETSGLIAPPDNYSVIHWVDPTYYPIQKRQILKDKNSLLYQWGVIKYNAKVAWYAFSYFSYLKFAAILFILLPFFFTNKEDKKNILIYFFSSLLVMAAYSLVFIEERYLIGCHFLFFIAVFFSFHCFYQQLLANFFKAKWLYYSLLLLLCISFCKNCYTQYSFWNSYRQEFAKSIPLENEIAQLTFLRNKRLANGPFDHGGISLDYISFKTGSQGFGNTNALQTEKEQYLDLKKHNIDYYFYQERSDNNPGYKNKSPEFLSGKTPVYNSPTGSIKIYALKPYAQ